MGGIVKNIGCGGVNRYGTGVGGRVCLLLPYMKLQSLKLILMFSVQKICPFLFLLSKAFCRFILSAHLRLFPSHSIVPQGFSKFSQSIPVHPNPPDKIKKREILLFPACFGHCDFIRSKTCFRIRKEALKSIQGAGHRVHVAAHAHTHTHFTSCLQEIHAASPF